MVERAKHHTLFAAELDALPYEELLKVAKQVAETMNTPGWAFLAQLLSERKARILDELASPTVREQSEYATRCAQAYGIDVALNAGQTVLYVAERAERQLEQLGEAA